MENTQVTQAVEFRQGLVGADAFDPGWSTLADMLDALSMDEYHAYWAQVGGA